MIKVAIIDDQVLLAKSLQYIIEKDEEINVVALGQNGNQALEICKKYSPNVILMDIQMPDTDGLEATKKIKETYKNIKVITLTTFENMENIMESFICGADGYIVKDIDPKELILSIKCVHSGLHVSHASVHKIIVREFSKALGKNFKVQGKNHEVTFSPSDVEIIKLVSQGRSNKEIAEILNFSEGTIKNKIAAILSRLKFRDRTQLVIFAIENNMI